MPGDTNLNLIRIHVRLGEIENRFSAMEAKINRLQRVADQLEGTVGLLQRLSRVLEAEIARRNELGV